MRFNQRQRRAKKQKEEEMTFGIIFESRYIYLLSFSLLVEVSKGYDAATVLLVFVEVSKGSSI